MYAVCTVVIMENALTCLIFDERVFATSVTRGKIAARK